MASIFDAVGNGLKGLFGSDFPERAAMAQAIVNGDADTAARIAGERAKRHDATALQQQIVGALRHKGMSDDDIAIVLANPDKFSEYWSQRFGTGNVDEGSSRVTGNLDGSQSLFTAPKTFQHGADVVQTPPISTVIPQGGAPRPPMMGQGGLPPMVGPGGESPDGNPHFQVTKMPGLRTDAEQYADSLGPRGSKAWGDAVRDYTMKAYGPSAQSMLGQRLQTQSDIAAGHDRTSAANNRRTTATSAANNARTTGQSNINNQRTTATSRANNQDTNATRRDTARHLRSGGEPVKVNSIEEARRLPPGTVFVTPDGRVKVR